MITKGCFTVIKNPDIKWEIQCTLLPEIKENEIPKDQKLLLQSVEDTSLYISILKSTRNEIKQKYFDELLSLAQIGLTGENPTPKLSLEELNKLKDKICLNEGSRIKNKYMLDLGKCVIICTLILLAFKIILSFYNISEIDKYIYVSIGSMIGTWISFGARKLKLSFEELGLIEEDGLNPYMRLVYICLCSNSILLFINSGLIEFTSLNLDNNNIELQFLLGIICGLIEYKIGIGLFNKANETLGKIDFNTK